MLLDARNATEVPEFLQSEVVIVGAGTVGLFLAEHLIRANKTVLLVDSGGRVADTQRAGDTAVSSGKDLKGLTLGRAFGLGGTSTLWGGQLVEFDEVDLTRGGRQWPIDYAELQRWYRHVYAFLELNDRQSNSAYRRKFGNELDAQGDLERFFTHWLPQPNFAVLFRRSIMSHPLLRIVLNATVNDIAFDESRATLLRARTGDGRTIRVAGTHFVFAAGTIETSRFFLSTQRRPGVPWASNGQVGTYFQDHLGGKIGSVHVKNEQKFRDYFENCFHGGVKLQPRLRLAPHVRKTVSSGVCGYFDFRSSLREKLDNVKFLAKTLGSGASFSRWVTLPADLWSLGRTLYPVALRYARDHRVLALFDRGLEFHVQAEQIPMMESSIRLADEEAQADGLCRAVVDWKVDGAEVGNIRDFARRADEYLRNSGIGRIELSEDELKISQLDDTYHQCGGMCMGASASDGVVDADCRVWGVPNVYVAGASVLPSSSYANSTLTALALAGRLSARLVEA